MLRTLVIQSHRQPLIKPWLGICMESVRRWASLCQFEYHYLGDELFDVLPRDLLVKTQAQKVIATDLARLVVLQQYLDQGFDTVVWCDADFLVFAPERLRLPSPAELPEGYALGREVWVQRQGVNSKKLKTYIKVHNACMLFRRGNVFLDFYRENAERLLRQTTGPMPPQFIGPKLLTAIHNVVQCPVLETAGMLSPLVLQDVISAGASSSALELFKRRSPQPIAGANLCGSLVDATLPLGGIEQAIEVLLKQGLP